jgi:kynurenine formamidase
MSGGRLDLVTPDKIRDAATLVRDGRVWDLAIDLDPQLLPPVDSEFARPLSLIGLGSSERWQRVNRSGEASFHLDAVSGSIHQGTHIDGLAHALYEGRIHGGAALAEALTDDGWSIHGAETIRPIVGRGVLIDLVRLKGSKLEGSHEITPDELASAARQQHVDICAGDIVLVRTGKMDSLRSDRERFLERQPGLGLEAALWLVERGMAAYGSDTGGTEPQPVNDWSRTVHVALLVERGIHLLEWLNLRALADAGRTDFLFVATPLKIRGATGSWVRPIAVT